MAEMHIEVWLDTVEEQDAPVWCVSLCEDGGDEIRYLGAYVDCEDAIDHAFREAAARGIEAYERDAAGVLHRLT